MDIGPPELIVGGQKPNIGRYIANAHTAFNLVNAIFFLVFLNYLVKLTVWLVPEKEGEGQLDELRHIKYIDSKYIDTPDVAIAQARAEIIRMGRAVEQMYDDVVFSLKGGNLQELSKWRKKEDTIDNLQKEIIQFLVQVVQRPITPGGIQRDCLFNADGQ